VSSAGRGRAGEAAARKRHHRSRQPLPSRYHDPTRASALTGAGMGPAGCPVSDANCRAGYRDALDGWAAPRRGFHCPRPLLYGHWLRRDGRLRRCPAAAAYLVPIFVAMARAGSLNAPNGISRHRRASAQAAPQIHLSSNTNRPGRKPTDRPAGATVSPKPRDRCRQDKTSNS